MLPTHPVCGLMTEPTGLHMSLQTRTRYTVVRPQYKSHARALAHVPCVTVSVSLLILSRRREAPFQKGFFAMITIEPGLVTIERAAERAIEIARFANEPVSFVFNEVNVVVKKDDNPFAVMLLQQMLQSDFVERLDDFQSYSYHADETKELIKKWVASKPSAISTLVERALA